MQPDAQSGLIQAGQRSVVGRVQLDPAQAGTKIERLQIIQMPTSKRAQAGVLHVCGFETGNKQGREIRIADGGKHILCNALAGSGRKAVATQPGQTIIQIDIEVVQRRPIGTDANDTQVRERVAASAG